MEGGRFQNATVVGSVIMTKPLVVIVGPTASGKTALGIKLAKEFGGEIISADSRAIYKDLSIGTAKPTAEERDGIVHWGFDVAQPGERYTAADFKRYALCKINEIRCRGNLPIIVGGTGLYVDAVLYNFQFSESSNDIARRNDLMMMSVDELHEYCGKNNVMLPENKMNKRHIVAAILRNGDKPKRDTKISKNTLVVGIATDRDELRARIEARSRLIFDSGVISEALNAAKKYGWESEAMTGNIYPLVRLYDNGEISRDELERRFAVSDWRLAKRQLTWFRRNKDIQWFSRDEAYTYIARHLDTVNKL